jgi:hypothetical protein
MDAPTPLRLAALAALACLALRPAVASGQAPAPGKIPPTRQDGRLTAQAKEEAQQTGAGRAVVGLLQHKTTPVPATLEIEVLDPNVDPLGNPAVITRRSEDGQTVAVDIPPVVLVHRYYFTGERSFQGPLLPGGPSIVVVSHPRTNERLYLDVQMLPGAPRVTYRRHSIEYDYGPQAITISFGLHGQPSVTYRNGVPILVKAERATAHVGQSTARLVQRTGLPEVGQKIGSCVKNVAETGADRVHDVGKAVAGPVVGFVKATPLATLLTSSPEDRAAKARDVAVKRAGDEAKQLEGSIPTVR